MKKLAAELQSAWDRLDDEALAEIAELREIPIDTVKSQLSRGRQALVELLTDRPAARTA